MVKEWHYSNCEVYMGIEAAKDIVSKEDGHAHAEELDIVKR